MYSFIPDSLTGILIMASIIKEKRDLRRISQSLRKQAFESYGATAAILISQHFKDWFKEKTKIKTIAFYYPIRTEVDPFPLINSLEVSFLRFCLPVVTGLERPLIFKEWVKDSELMISSYGAKIPMHGPLLTPDLIIAPLLACDQSGSRLGYGGGFYDRTIEVLRRHKKIVVLGLAFECQRTEVIIPTEPTDQKIDWVLTEKGFYSFKNP